MCGIFGWAGKDPKKFNKDKFDKLGIYNIERGKDSCGVAIDGNVKIGIGFNNKEYSGFIVNNNDLIPKMYPVVIGHTRQASTGSVVNESNAHPFAFGLNKKKEAFEFIGCHNGTLYNHTNLAEKYDIEVNEKISKKLENDSYSVSSRKKIDSEILLEIIYTYKNFKVLSEYNGAAALMFTDTNEPNKVYIWKGASRLYDYSTNIVQEERPLFYYIENKNSLYISSLKDSLKSIGASEDKNLFSFDDNTVYIITDGDISKAEKHKISREKSTQKEIYKSTNYSRHGYNISDFNTNDFPTDKETESEKLVKEFAEKKQVNLSRQLNIYNESLLMDQNFYGKKVYFNKLRYWKKGHLVTGIYTFINGYGFYQLSEGVSRAGALKIIEDRINIPFVKDDFDFTYGLEESKNLNLKIPFRKNEPNNLFYFVEGVRIKTYTDYQVMFNLFTDLLKGEYMDYYKLSYVACHPVIDLSITSRAISSQGVIYNGLPVSNIIAPLGSELIYHFDFGNLKNTQTNTYGKRSIFGYSSSATELKEKFKTRLEAKKALKEIEDAKIIELEENFNTKIIPLIPESFVNYDNDENITELAGEYELISENLNEAVQGIQDHISKLSQFNYPEVDKKISQLKILRDQITLTLEKEE